MFVLSTHTSLPGHLQLISINIIAICCCNNTYALRYYSYTSSIIITNNSDQILTILNGEQTTIQKMCDNFAWTEYSQDKYPENLFDINFTSNKVQEFWLFYVQIFLIKFDITFQGIAYLNFPENNVWKIERFENGMNHQGFIRHLTCLRRFNCITVLCT